MRRKVEFTRVAVARVWEGRRERMELRSSSGIMLGVAMGRRRIWVSYGGEV